jgi:cobalt/nickel transport protein
LDIGDLKQLRGIDVKSVLAFSVAATIAASGAAIAHYGMIIPSDPMVSQEDGRSISLNVSFSHPFELAGMELVRPVAFSVTHDGETTDLLDALAPATIMESPGFTLEYELARPGTYVFAMEPEPYWEPAEDSFIIHYTKTYVSAYGDDEGWDAMLGLRTEIEPLTRPFGIWEGNVFQGRVLLEGEPVPFAEVEVEYFNEDLTATSSSDLMITQTIVADAEGVFSYVTPGSGWWGFAALNTAPETIALDGVEKAVELGAVIWVHFEDWTGR